MKSWKTRQTQIAFYKEMERAKHSRFTSINYKTGIPQDTETSFQNQNPTLDAQN